MKTTILTTILDTFEEWAAQEHFSCQGGCSVCCTRNVTITSLEGRQILEFFAANCREKALAQILNTVDFIERPVQTTNEYVRDIMDGRENQETAPHQGVCPFLHNDLCTIYPVRPFSCRCFASTTVCTKQRGASVPDHYLYGSMAAMQLIEHLDQFNQWGIMTDVLLSLTGSPKYQNTYDQYINNDRVITAKNNLRPAQPLPGLAVPEPCSDKIGPLIQAILTTRVDHRTIEQIFNGNR